MEAKFVTTPRGARVLSHGGYRYNRTWVAKDRSFWQCNQHGSTCRYQCTACANTIEVKGKMMVKLPPNNMHDHKPLFQSDSE